MELRPFNYERYGHSIPMTEKHTTHVKHVRHQVAQLARFTIDFLSEKAVYVFPEDSFVVTLNDENTGGWHGYFKVNHLRVKPGCKTSDKEEFSVNVEIAIYSPDGLTVTHQAKIEVFEMIGDRIGKQLYHRAKICDMELHVTAKREYMLGDRHPL